MLLPEVLQQCRAPTKGGKQQALCKQTKTYSHHCRNIYPILLQPLHCASTHGLKEGGHHNLLELVGHVSLEDTEKQPGCHGVASTLLQLKKGQGLTKPHFKKTLMCVWAHLAHPVHMLIFGECMGQVWRRGRSPYVQVEIIFMVPPCPRGSVHLYQGLSLQCCKPCVWKETSPLSFRCFLKTKTIPQTVQTGLC